MELGKHTLLLSMLEKAREWEDKYKADFKKSYEFFLSINKVHNIMEELSNKEVRFIVQNSKNLQNLRRKINKYNFNFFNLPYKYESIENKILLELKKEDEQIFTQWNKPELDRGELYWDSIEYLKGLKRKPIKKEKVMEIAVKIEEKKEPHKVVTESYLRKEKERKEREKSNQLFQYFRNKNLKPVWNEEQKAFLKGLLTNNNKVIQK